MQRKIINCIGYLFIAFTVLNSKDEYISVSTNDRVCLMDMLNNYDIYHRQKENETYYWFRVIDDDHDNIILTEYRYIIGPTYMARQPIHRLFW